jgi:hypothetical protein
MLKPWRFAVVVLSTLVGVTYFWFGSRYPDLNAKALMVGGASMSDALTVWPLFDIHPFYPLWKRIGLGTLNWLYANWKGMLFGVCFGGAFLTLLSYFRLPRRQNTFSNTVLGFAMGAPLGVCVNCAAPVFKGMLRCQRTETAFAAMLSSPTMNVVVLTMVFSFFPLYMGMTKIAFTLLMVFLSCPRLHGG